MEIFGELQYAVVVGVSSDTCFALCRYNTLYELNILCAWRAWDQKGLSNKVITQAMSAQILISVGVLVTACFCRYCLSNALH